MTLADRPRRSCLTVPGSGARFLAKATSLPADEVILDLEDAVAPAAKQDARVLVTRALAEGDWGSAGRVLAVRINAVPTQWAYRDVIDVVEASGGRLDAIVLPKVTRPAHVVWLDLLLNQVEQASGLPQGKIAIEAQIEDGAGLAAADDIAAASDRLAALIFGPADFMASLGMRSLTIGARPEGYAGGDAFHYPLMRLLVAARAAGLQAIDGPYAAIGDTEGLTAASASAAALGFDGKWVVHPDQIGPVNAAFSPSQEQYERAEQILEAYEHATTVQRRGAVMLGAEMIDEASRKMALVAAARGRAAGMVRRHHGRELRLWWAWAEHRSVDGRGKTVLWGAVWPGACGCRREPCGCGVRNRAGVWIVSLYCPRCGSLALPPSAWSSSWRCDKHGDIYPLRQVRSLSSEGLAGLLRNAVVPVMLPWPLPDGWLVTGFAAVGDERSGTRACAVALSGPNPVGGPGEMLVICEELGVGLGANCAGLEGPDPGAGFPSGLPDAQVEFGNHEFPLWHVDAPGRAVFVGEMMGTWLWVLLWPDTAGTLLVEPITLRDLRDPGQDLDLPFGARSPRLPG